MDALLSTKDLRKTYGTFFLGPVNLTVPKGSIVGLIGENGAGKTTLIKCILGLAKGRGEVILLPDNPPGRDVRQDLGIVLGTPGIPGNMYLWQVARVMEATYDNWDRPMFIEYVKRFELSKENKFSQYSAGQKMKLGLAIALSHHPKLLILDEPAAGLDPVARDELSDILFEFTRDETCGVLISSHILSDLERVCDYIAFLHEGNLLFCEEKDRLLERYGLYRCSEEERRALPPQAVAGCRSGNYAEEVLIDKTVLPDLETGRTTIEDIMVLMVKGAK